ncbi:MAG: response regulator [Alphaproteobacteria bacterium]|nr:response regulator [Alphaproteobacteria bacterium]
MKVLVIDKDPLFARIAKSRLEKWGYETSVVDGDGTKALEQYNKEEYRIVIMDLRLTGTSGIDLCRTIRETSRSHYTYIIIYGSREGTATDQMYTSREDKDELLLALEAGADDFILKPFNTIELKLLLKNATRMLEMDDELYHGGGVDKATGVITRSAFMNFFDVINAQCIRGKLTGTLMFLRVTNADTIGRTYGYQASHSVITGAAAKVRAIPRTSDIIAKTGDDEFCFLLQNTYWDKCLPVAKRIHETLKGYSIKVGNEEVKPIIEISIVDFPYPEKIELSQMIDDKSIRTIYQP